MHYTNGGKHVGTADHTLITADVTCGNCIRTRAFRQAMDTVTAIEDTTEAVKSLADAGFFTGYAGHNHVINANFSITGVDRFGIMVTYGNGRKVTFPHLVEFLAWITPADMTRVIEHVMTSEITWVAAMDIEWALSAEVKSVNAIEEAVNFVTADALMERIRELCKVTVIPQTLDNGAVVYYARCEHDWETGFHAEANDARDVARGHGTISRPLYEYPQDAWIGAAERQAERAEDARRTALIAEDAESAPKPFRTSGKVKSTSAARRRNKGA